MAQVGRLLGQSAQLRSVLQRQDAVRATVVRVELDDGTTVIAKRGRSFAPLDPTPTPKSSWALFNELVALKLMAERCPDTAPHIVAVDHRLGILVMADLGHEPNLPELLRAGGRVVAEEALLRWTLRLASLHARRLLTQQGSIRDLRDALAPGGTLDGYLDVAGAECRFAVGCTSLGLLTPRRQRECSGKPSPRWRSGRRASRHVPFSTSVSPLQAAGWTRWGRIGRGSRVFGVDQGRSGTLAVAKQKCL